MKMKITLRCLLLAAALLLGGMTAFAQTETNAVESGNLRAELEMLRSDANTYKVRVMNQALQLTGPEAEKFWPIYREYEHELAAVNDRKIALLRGFIDRSANGTLDNEAADKLSEEWLQNVQDRLDLWKKYRKKIAEALSPARAAQFLQAENQMSLFVDVNIATEMPALRTVIKH